MKYNSEEQNDSAKAPRRKKAKPPVLDAKKYYVWQCRGKWDRFERTHDMSCRHINVKASFLTDGNRDNPFMGKCESCGKNTRLSTSGNSKFILEVYNNKQAAYYHAHGMNMSLKREKGEEE